MTCITYPQLEVAAFELLHAQNSTCCGMPAGYAFEPSKYAASYRIVLHNTAGFAKVSLERCTLPMAMLLSASCFNCFCSERIVCSDLLCTSCSSCLCDLLVSLSAASASWCLHSHVQSAWHALHDFSKDYWLVSRLMFYHNLHSSQCGKDVMPSQANLCFDRSMLRLLEVE